MAPQTSRRQVAGGDTAGSKWRGQTARRGDEGPDKVER